ncbi:hypothetical protein SAMN05421757_10492 [Tropicimonas sediminicola]|uniref:Uncharacterized protein n=1 Tax=Tropicimonas sediminicola TaxID=1031541 RepID=A0A239HXY6_9RHOB|nr:hypothetical protein SAMN05421757_10492 [Tropicimonas sediminicola]
MHPNHGYQMLTGVRRRGAKMMFGSMRDLAEPIRTMWRAVRS